MADVSQSQEVASWVQTGGLLAFASAVYWEIRQIRPWMIAIFESLAVIRGRDESAPIDIPVRKRPRVKTPHRPPTDKGDG